MGDMAVVGNGAHLPCLAWSQKKIAGEVIGPNDVAEACVHKCAAVIMQWKPDNLEQGRPGRAEHAAHPPYRSMLHAG
jgi:hypothetical protein